MLISYAFSSDIIKGIGDKSENSEIKNVIITDLQDVSFAKNSDLRDGSCREVSLHKCGSSIVRVFSLLDFLPPGKSLDSKCTLRKAFFTCLKTDKEPCKKRRWSIYHTTAFRKKLVRSLWSTRNCVFGLRPEENDV
ncbi:hypothetical protein JTE90_018075 [Oedothorax gibbosus]|uniref:Uncharacterized protein n=1 Tax=Oedothorax gibbosus TaxID=931172 RepID=A0AAV6UDG3_9ARAC|nr:hypothetical protein JTE90_018075 [Oedothorax gibbosus]